MKEKTRKKGGCLKFLGIGFLVIIGLSVIGAMIGGEDSSEESATSSKETSSQTETVSKEVTKEETKEEPKEEPASYGVGDEVPVGDVVFTVNSIETADQVGPSVLPDKAQGKFVVLDVTFNNGGNEAVTMDASYFKLLLGEKTYDSDSAASMSANQSEDGSIETSFFLEEVNPDSQITGKVVFDVNPDVAESADLILQVQSGFWGTETEEIKLR